MAGFKVAWASEFIPAAQETYRANHPETHLDTRDIRTVKPEDILDVLGMTVVEAQLAMLARARLRHEGRRTLPMLAVALFVAQLAGFLDGHAAHCAVSVIA